MTTAEKTAKKYNKVAKGKRTLQLVKMSLLRNLPPEVSQRPVNERDVARIFNNFDLDKMQTPHVSHRDGYYWIMDGQHTIEALKRWLGDGWEDQNLECWVYEGLTERDESDWFNVLNSGKRPTIYIKYKTGVTAGYPTETGVHHILTRLGLIATTQNVPGSISAVGTCIRAYRRDGDIALERGLLLAHNAFGDPGLESSIIDGFSMLCNRYNGSLDEKTSMQSLSSLKGGVKGLLGLAEQLRLKTGGRKAECVAASAINIINRQRTGKNKLPSWFK